MKPFTYFDDNVVGQSYPVLVTISIFGPALTIRLFSEQHHAYQRYAEIRDGIYAELDSSQCTRLGRSMFDFIVQEKGYNYSIETWAIGGSDKDCSVRFSFRPETETYGINIDFGGKNVVYNNNWGTHGIPTEVALDIASYIHNAGVQLSLLSNAEKGTGSSP